MTEKTIGVACRMCVRGRWTLELAHIPKAYLDPQACASITLSNPECRISVELEHVYIGFVMEDVKTSGVSITEE